MRTLFIAFLLSCGVAQAQDWKPYRLIVEDINTNATAKMYTVDGITGEVMAYSIKAAGATNVTVSVATTAGYGSSLWAAKTLVSTGMTNGLQANVGSVYLAGDRLTLSVSSAEPGYSTTLDCEAVILVKE